MPFKLHVNNLLDVDTHFSKGYYSTDNILESKGNRVHTTLLTIVGIFGVLYTIISFLQGYHYQAILILSCAVFALIAWIIHLKGYTLISKLVNFIQLITVIGLLFYFPSSTHGEHVNDSVLAFYVPILIGTLIAFQGKQKIFGQLLATIVLLLIPLLVLTDTHYHEHPIVEDLKGANYDMLFNILGAAIATFAEVAYILALNNRLNSSLIKTNHELDNFIYIVSHDLRSPLLSTKGLIDLAKMKIGEREQVLKYLSLASKSINNLDDIIHEILAYSRNARTNLNEENFDIKELVKEVFDGLRFAAGNHFRFREEYVGDTILYCDKSRLSTVLRNIIGNSVKYQRKDISTPEVFFRFENLPNKCLISITDNGEGIPAESQQKVFDMFYRGTSTGSGSGLGLYICKEMLDKMNARYSINSVPGEGTSFTISLNKNTATTKETSTPQKAAEATFPFNNLPGLRPFNQAG